MADDGAPIFLDQRIHGVDRLRVGVIEPGAEDTQPAQLAAVLVRHDVVGIVGAGALGTRTLRAVCLRARPRRWRGNFRPASCCAAFELLVDIGHHASAGREPLGSLTVASGPMTRFSRRSVPTFNCGTKYPAA